MMSLSSVRQRWVVVATAVVLGLSATGTAAAAPVADCTTIDAPGTFTLTGDVTATDPADGVCINVTAAGVVLDGAGNALVGAGNGTGIAVQGSDDVTVRDVRVEGWSTGLAVESGADGFAVVGSTIVGNGIGDDNPGVLLNAGDQDTPPLVVQNVFRENLNGLQIGSTRDAEVRGNDFVDNVRSGVTVSGSGHGTRIVRNRIVGSDLGVDDPPQLASSGVFVSLSSGVEIHENLIRHNGNGIQVFFFTFTDVRRNAIVDNRRGVWIRSQWDGMRAHCNKIAGNSDHGVENAGGTVQNVTRNYWGARDGPGGGATDAVTGAVADGSGDAVSADLHWDPFIRSPRCGSDDDDTGGGTANDPPQADLVLHPSDPPVGANVLFDGSDSVDPDGEIVEYRWEIDGETVEFGERVHHRFTEPGSHHFVSLTVTDDDGDTDTVTRHGITVWQGSGKDEGEDGEDDDEDADDDTGDDDGDGHDSDDGDDTNDEEDEDDSVDDGDSDDADDEQDSDEDDRDESDDADDEQDSDEGDGDERDDGDESDDGGDDDMSDDEGDEQDSAGEFATVSGASDDGDGQGVVDLVVSALGDILGALG